MPRTPIHVTMHPAPGILIKVNYVTIFTLSIFAYSISPTTSSSSSSGSASITQTQPFIKEYYYRSVEQAPPPDRRSSQGGNYNSRDNTYNGHRDSPLDHPSSNHIARSKSHLTLSPSSSPSSYSSSSSSPSHKDSPIDITMSRRGPRVLEKGKHSSRQRIKENSSHFIPSPSSSSSSFPTSPSFYSSPSSSSSSSSSSSGERRRGKKQQPATSSTLVYHEQHQSRAFTGSGSEIDSKYPRSGRRHVDSSKNKLQDPWHRSKDLSSRDRMDGAHHFSRSSSSSSSMRDNASSFLSKKEPRKSLKSSSPSGNHAGGLSKSPFDGTSDDTASPKETWYALKIPLTPVASKGHQSGDSSESANSNIRSSSSSSTATSTSSSIGNTRSRSRSRSSIPPPPPPPPPASSSSSLSSLSPSSSSYIDPYTTSEPSSHLSGGGSSHDVDGFAPSSYTRLLEPSDHKETRVQDQSGDFYYRYSAGKQQRDGSEKDSGRHERLKQKDINHSYDLKAAGGRGKEASTFYRVTDGLEKDTGGSKSYYYTKSTLSHIRHKPHEHQGEGPGDGDGQRGEGEDGRGPRDAGQGGAGSFARTGEEDEEGERIWRGEKHSSLDTRERSSSSSSKNAPTSPASSSSSSASRSSTRGTSRIHLSPGPPKWSRKASTGFKIESGYRPDDRTPTEQDEDAPVIFGRTIAPPAAASVSVYHQQNPSHEGEKSLDFDEQVPKKNTTSSKLSKQQSTKLIVKSIQDILDTVRNSES